MRETDIHGTPCVAVVDDDESLCRSLARLLRASGITSVAYRSAEEFLRDATAHRFDALILDVQLGGLSGLELQERLAASGSVTPVVFLTAHGEADLRARAHRAGCASYLLKSDPGEKVLAALSAALQQAPPGRPAPSRRGR